MIKKRYIFVLLMVMLFLTALPASAQSQVHIVRQGETVAAIAQRYGVTMQSLVTLNGILNPNVIYVGQRLNIPPRGGTTMQPTTRSHVVRAGEELRFIAARYGTTWQALAAVNNIRNPNLIYVGQVLVIPAIGGPVTAPAPIVGGRYVVQPGDTMFKIGARFGVDVWSIARANGILNLNRIYSGQSLVIPGR